MREVVHIFTIILQLGHVGRVSFDGRLISVPLLYVDVHGRLWTGRPKRNDNRYVEDSRNK